MAGCSHTSIVAVVCLDFSRREASTSNHRSGDAGR